MCTSGEEPTPHLPALCCEDAPGGADLQHKAEGGIASSSVIRRRPPAFPLLLLLAIVPLAACGGDDEATDGPTTTRRTTTTTVDRSTTTGAPASTITVADGTGSTTTTAKGDAATTTAAAPKPPSDPVPDGNSFGYLKGVDVGGSTITIDIAELLTGDEAVQAAIEDGVLEPGETSIDNDYYIRNKNAKLRTAPVAPTATVRTLDDVGSPDLSTSSMTSLAGDLAERSTNEPDGIPIRIVAAGGIVSHVEEVFFP
jgi:hypothetical protein